MKKIVIFVFLIFFMLPSSVLALSIKNTSLTGANQAVMNKEVTLTFAANFVDLDIDSTNGILAVDYEINFDDSVFDITRFSSDNGNWESQLVKQDGKYYIVSIVDTNDPGSNQCNNMPLHCGDYQVNITFTVKECDRSVSSIGIGTFEVIAFDSKDFDETKEYQAEEIVNMMSSTSLDVNKEQLFAIYKTEPTPTPDVDGKTPLPTIDPSEYVNPNPEVEETEEGPKSDNNYLSNIEIEGYDIHFDKEIEEYPLTIQKGVNKLNIKVTKENKMASYHIKGADDLKENNYLVEITVTAHNGDQRVYTIKVNAPLEEEEKEEGFLSWISSVNPIIWWISGGSILGVIIIVGGIIHWRNKKFDKKLDDVL